MVFKKGYKLTKEQLKKRGLNISKALKGKPKSKKHIKKMRLAKKGNQKGKDNPNWKGGIMKSEGYIWIYMPINKFQFRDNHVRRSHLIWYEKTGEIIKKPFEIHHINGNKQDDRFENLKKVTRSEHQKIHSKTAMRCKNCGEWKGKNHKCSHRQRDKRGQYT